MLVLWIFLQLLALAMAAGRVPLSAHFPHPIEYEATAEMAVVQVVAAALLFPSLLSNWVRWGAVVASTWPMLKLASLLGGEPAGCVGAAAMYVAVWLLALGLWASVLRTDRSEMCAMALVCLWTLGGPVLVYLHGEFAGTDAWPLPGDSPLWAPVAGPVWAVLAHLWGSPLALVSDIPLATVVAGGIIFAYLKFFHADTSDNKLSTGS